MGRVSGTWTTIRKEAYAEIVEAAESGRRITLARIARRCRLTDHRNARRTVEDIRRIIGPEMAAKTIDVALRGWPRATN